MLKWRRPQEVRLNVYLLVYHAFSATPAKLFKGMAGTTGLEPAASAVTGGRSPAGPRRISRLGVRLSATVGFIGQRRLVFVQRFVQPSSPCRARAKTYAEMNNYRCH